MKFKISLLSVLSLSLIACGDGYNYADNPNANPNLVENQKKLHSNEFVKDKSSAIVTADNYLAIASRVYKNMYFALSASTHVINKDRALYVQTTGSCDQSGSFTRMHEDLAANSELQFKSKISSTYTNCDDNGIFYNGTTTLQVKPSDIGKNDVTIENFSTSNDLTFGAIQGLKVDSLKLKGTAEVRYIDLPGQTTTLLHDIKYTLNRDKLSGMGLALYSNDKLSRLEMAPESKQELIEYGIVEVSTHAGSNEEQLFFEDNKLVKGTVIIKCANAKISITAIEGGKIQVKANIRELGSQGSVTNHQSPEIDQQLWLTR